MFVVRCSKIAHSSRIRGRRPPSSLPRPPRLCGLAFFFQLLNPYPGQGTRAQVEADGQTISRAFLLSCAAVVTRRDSRKAPRLSEADSKEDALAVKGSPDLISRWISDTLPVPGQHASLIEPWLLQRGYQHPHHALTLMNRMSPAAATAACVPRVEQRRFAARSRFETRVDGHQGGGGSGGRRYLRIPITHTYVGTLTRSRLLSLLGVGCALTVPRVPGEFWRALMQGPPSSVILPPAFYGCA